MVTKTIICSGGKQPLSEGFIRRYSVAILIGYWYNNKPERELEFIYQYNLTLLTIVVEQQS